MGKMVAAKTKPLSRIGHGCEESVIRVLKKIRKWSPLTRGSFTFGSRVQIEVEFFGGKADLI
jgi:hypothetical protein